MGVSRIGRSGASAGGQGRESGTGLPSRSPENGSRSGRDPTAMATAPQLVLRFGYPALCGFLAAVILLIDSKTPVGVAGGVPYVFVIFLALQIPKIGATLLFAGICTVLTILGLILSPPGESWPQFVWNRFLAIFVIWATAGLGLRWRTLQERHELALNEREEALNQVRVLRGLIPICASCKKIRDEVGLWEQFEQYIQSHSEAQFSHGICPECAREHHGIEIAAGTDGPLRPPSDNER